MMEMIYERKTDKTFAEAVRAVRKEVSKLKYGVLFELNFKDILLEKGFEFDKNFTVLEICSPKQAKEMMDKHLEVGYFLPCKAAVYEKEGAVYIGMFRLGYLVEAAGIEGIDSVIEEIERDIKEAIEKAV